MAYKASHLKTIDLQLMASEQGISFAEARARLRRRLKDGLVWSRLNPDLLSADELLPCMLVDEPPASPVTLAPFPIAREKLRGMEAGQLDAEYLAREKINWCYQGRRRPGQAVAKRVLKQMMYYDLKVSQGHVFGWVELNPLVSPYLPLVNMLLPAFANFALAKPYAPQPPQALPGEAWHTPEPDDFGVSLHCSATFAEDEIIIFALSLTREKMFWLQNFRLSPARYIFLRQQLVFLLNQRLAPWLPGEIQSHNTLRGRIYKKP